MRFLSPCDRTNPWISQRPQHLKSHQRRSWIWYQRTLLCWIARCCLNNIRLEKAATWKFKTDIKLFANLLPSLLLLCWIIDILVYLANKHGWNTLIKKVKYENVGYIRLEKAATCKFKTNIQLFANSFHSSSRCWLINILVYLPNLTKRNFVRTKKSQQVNQTKK